MSVFVANVQLIEQQLEELRQQYRDTERAMSKQSQGLEVRVNQYWCMSAVL
jgi:hypothetical protein